MDWSDIASSTGFQLGYPLLSALVSATGPRGANIAQGLNTGMAITNRYAEQRKADEQNKLLGQSLGNLLKSTTPVSSTQSVASMPVNPATASFEMPGVKEQTIDDINPSQKLGDALAPVPLEKQTTVTQKPAFSPQVQQLGDALVNARRPDMLLPMLTRELMRDPKLTSVRPGGSLVDEQGNVKYQAPPPPVREATPPRPVFGTQGGEGVSSVYNPATKQWEVNRAPLTAAPARQLPPEESERVRAQTAVENARIPLIGAQMGAANASASNSKAQAGAATARASRLNNLAKTAADPRATTGQASAAMNALIRERDSIETPEEDKPVINDAIRAVRSRLADIGKNPNGAQPAAAAPQPAAAPPGKPIGRTKDGKTVYQGADGKKYVAN